MSDDQLRVFQLEQIAKQLPQGEMVTDHDFCAGMYARTMHIPAGAMATGAIHRHESFFVVREGVLLISSGGPAVKVGPGFMSVTKPGEKRVALAITDAKVTNFHANPDELRDEAEMWEHFTVPEPQDLIETLDKRKLEAR